MWNPDKFANSLIVDWKHLATSVGFSILGMVPACVITMTCYAISKKADYLLEDCYRLRYKFSYESYEHRELLALTTYMSENRLVFTAVDYFIIRPSVLLGIIGTSTTYFIAIIQFS
ncbi:hypothetical protein D910_11227 [Dendroctonus ponderosae]|uniref:Gustatory receptor n=2 Tax=Dendroctonus ponderosae TaxID=77166 RepID=U4UUR6_DENPD|nr:hypothetical protein D910_11227 [Dendroctonus ponderosae]